MIVQDQLKPEDIFNIEGPIRRAKAIVQEMIALMGTSDLNAKYVEECRRIEEVEWMCVCLLGSRCWTRSKTLCGTECDRSCRVYSRAYLLCYSIQDHSNLDYELHFKQSRHVLKSKSILNDGVDPLVCHRDAVTFGATVEPFMHVTP